MRIWDVHPGYLNRQSLLGEHRELHGIVSIIVNNKKGYSSHPETVRWIGRGWALRQRHRILAAEMALRGFTDKTPVITRSNKGAWPETFVDEPWRQFEILKEKYRIKEPGRIPLPKNAQELWAHHKYSILARDQNLYRQIGRKVSRMGPSDDFSELTAVLTESLRTAPPEGGLRNALLHMWGHVSSGPPELGPDVRYLPAHLLLGEIQKRVMKRKEPYLSASTALSELTAWF